MAAACSRPAPVSHTAAASLSAPDDRERWLALGDFLLTNDGKLRRKVDVLLGFPRDDHGEKARMRAMLATLDEDADFPEALLAVRKLPPARYTDEQWAILLSVFRVLPVATVELQRIFLTRGISDYIEIAQNAAAALGTPEQPGPTEHGNEAFVHHPALPGPSLHAGHG
jgi:hypothetical protein